MPVSARLRRGSTWAAVGTWALLALVLLLPKTGADRAPDWLLSSLAIGSAAISVAGILLAFGAYLTGSDKPWKPTLACALSLLVLLSFFMASG